MRKTQIVSHTALRPTDINDGNDGPVGLTLWYWTLIYIILNFINSKIFSALSKKKLWAYPKHPRPPPTTTVQNPQIANAPTCQPSPYYWSETACPVFRALSLKILFFWEVTKGSESAVGPENEETTILQQLLPHTQQPYVTSQKN